MTQNLNQTDRFLRILLSVLIGAQYVFGVINGILATVLIIVALVWSISSCISFCPIYKLLGLSTKKEIFDSSNLSD